MESAGNIQDECSTCSDEHEEDHEQRQGFYYSVTHPNGSFHRFIVLFFMCFLGFGSYFCYDNPAALQDNFTKDLNLTTTEFTMLYSFYSWPNVVLCFIGGFLIDRVFGIQFGANLYMFITLLGQIIFATGATTNTFPLMLLGRFIFGIGGESLAVAQNHYAVLWFKGKELNMVFGLQLSFARIGSSVNFWVMESVYEFVGEHYQGYECLGVTLFLAGSTCLISMVCALTIGCLDKRADRILRRNVHNDGAVVQFSDIKDFPGSFWLISVICVSYYVAVFPFIALAKKFFMTKFHVEPKVANNLNSIVYFISAGASPLLGLVVDKTGRNVFYVIMAICCTIGAHLMMGFTMWNPYIGMITMGLGYSMLASGLWPLVSLIIPETQLGTAYGICQAIQNLGLAVISLLTGVIVDTGNYTFLELFFIGSLTISLIATFVVLVIDKRSNGILNLSPGQREERHNALMAAEVLERERLLSAGSSFGTSDLQPHSNLEIRNRPRVSNIPFHRMPTATMTQ